MFPQLAHATACSVHHLALISKHNKNNSFTCTDAFPWRLLTLCSPSSTYGTSSRSPELSFGTNTVAMHTEFNPIVLHSWIQWHCMELIVTICRVPSVNYTCEPPALSLLLLFQLGYLCVLKGEVSPNNNVDWVSRKQFYKPNSKILSKFW